MTVTRDELLDRAWRAFDDESYEEAEALARRALMADPDSVEARLAAARALANQEDYGAALPLLREAIALDGGDAEARTVIGICLFETCSFAGALENLEKAAALGADTPDFYYWFGMLLERTGKYEEAEEHFKRAHHLDPDCYPLPMRLSRQECVRAVEEARALLPHEYDACLENVAIRVEDLPSDELLEDEDHDMDPCLLGLFVGVPITEKAGSGASVEMPDMIFIFQRNLERSCPDRETLVEEIAKTLYHEIGHYMGRDEDELTELGMA
jgi:predicted Zn-dependent protease with MMP-like domain